MRLAAPLLCVLARAAQTQPSVANTPDAVVGQFLEHVRQGNLAQTRSLCAVESLETVGFAELTTGDASKASVKSALEGLGLIN